MTTLWVTADNVSLKSRCERGGTSWGLRKSLSCPIFHLLVCWQSLDLPPFNLLPPSSCVPLYTPLPCWFSITVPLYTLLPCRFSITIPLCMLAPCQISITVLLCMPVPCQVSITVPLCMPALCQVFITVPLCKTTSCVPLL